MFDCTNIFFSGQCSAWRPIQALHVSDSFLFPSPVSHMRRNDSCGLLRTMLPPKCLDKIPLGIHKVEIDAVVDEVVLARLHALRRREIHAICLAHIFDLLPGPREADQIGVELGKVRAQHGRCVAGRVACYEDGHHRGSRLGDFVAHDVDHASHLVKLFRADIWAVGETEVHLMMLALASKHAFPASGKLRIRTCKCCPGAAG
jgi:hypothetical protein